MTLWWFRLALKAVEAVNTDLSCPPSSPLPTLQHLAPTRLRQKQRTQRTQKDTPARQIEHPSTTPKPCSDERRDDAAEAAPEAREAARGAAYRRGEGFWCPAVEHGIEGRLDCDIIR